MCPAPEIAGWQVTCKLAFGLCLTEACASFCFVLFCSPPRHEKTLLLLSFPSRQIPLFLGAQAGFIASLPIISNLIMNHHMRKVTSVSHENLNHILLNWENFVDASFRVSIFICFLLKSFVACGSFFTLGGSALIN